MGVVELAPPPPAEVEGASARKPFVCEETDRSYGQLTVAVGSSEIELCNPRNAHNNIIVVNRNLGARGNSSSFNTLTGEQQQVGVVELAPPPPAELEGNAHPPPEDRNVIMGKLLISVHVQYIDCLNAVILKNVASRTHLRVHQYKTHDFC